jgi:predicted  nucleic acid-binding Zn-ribbon protein
MPNDEPRPLSVLPDIHGSLPPAPTCARCGDPLDDATSAALGVCKSCDLVKYLAHASLDVAGRARLVEAVRVAGGVPAPPLGERAALTALRWVADAPDEVAADVIRTYARGAVGTIEEASPELAAWTVESADRWRYSRAIAAERHRADSRSGLAAAALAAALLHLAGCGEEVDAGLLAWAVEYAPVGVGLDECEARAWQFVEDLRAPRPTPGQPATGRAP